MLQSCKYLFKKVLQNSVNKLHDSHVKYAIPPLLNLHYNKAGKIFAW